MSDEVDEAKTRRLFILERMIDPHIDAKIMVENMHAAWRWAETGELPSATIVSPWKRP
jgi:hypothetical protein